MCKTLVSHRDPHMLFRAIKAGLSESPGDDVIGGELSPKGLPEVSSMRGRREAGGPRRDDLSELIWQMHASLESYPPGAVKDPHR